MGTFARNARSTVRALVKNHPAVKRALISAETDLGLLRHTFGRAFPGVIQPQPRKLTVAITAHCNLRCVGCRYGRDFMPGHQLPYPMIEALLDDAKTAGIESVRFYGGEPLLHPDLPSMVRHAIDLGLSPYLTTNGILLKQKIDGLYRAGLRNITIGYYGTGEDYDRYVQRDGRWRRLEEGVAAVRDRYGAQISIQINFLLMRPSCDVEALEKAWDFAQRYDLEFQTDLIHYSLPYFTEGPNRELQFSENDRGRIEEVVVKLVELKIAYPQRMKEPLPSILSIPDWILKGPDMCVPCDTNRLIWVGADGTVQLCYVTFLLGNLHHSRLRDMLFSEEHRRAARDAFALKCPHCHCHRDSRIMKHLPSRRYYSAMTRGLGREAEPGTLQPESALE
jgi:molybdenum cofactor biosynthesis enzyme MoaA